MNLSCKSCERGFSRNEAKFPCNGFCGRFFHVNSKCVKLAEYDMNLIMENNNIKYMCDECCNSMSTVASKIQGILNVIQENKTIMEKQEGEIKLLLKHVQKLSDENVNVISILKKVEESKAVSENGEAKRSYAHVLKEPPVILKPKTKQSASKTREDVKKKVDPTNLKITAMEGRSNGILTISCENEQERNKVKSAMEQKSSDKYEVKIAELRKPKIYVCGMSEDTKEEILERKLKNQNDVLANSEVKCLKTFKVNKQKNGRMHEYFNAVIELDAECFHRVMQAKKLNVGWDRCNVFEAVNIKRCYKCQGFNHKSDECKNSAACARCAGEHDTRACDQDIVNKCVNCMRVNRTVKLNLDINHNTRSVDCPVYLRKVNAEKKKVGY